MDPWRRKRPLGEWLLGTFPNDERVRIEAKLFGERHYFVLGDYQATLEVIGGELRGTLAHVSGGWPHIAEDGIMIDLPEAVAAELRARKDLVLADVVDGPGLPALRISRITDMDDVMFLEFERA